MRVTCLVSMLFGLTLMTGCYTKTGPHVCIPRVSPPGVINHVVFFDLQNPEDASELIRDCCQLLNIGGVISGYAGRHYDIGRPEIQSDYDVGFFVAFDTEEDYRTYLEHPSHKHLAEKWKARWDSIRIYDIGNHWSLYDPHQ